MKDIFYWKKTKMIIQIVFFFYIILMQINENKWNIYIFKKFVLPKENPKL